MKERTDVRNAAERKSREDGDDVGEGRDELEQVKNSPADNLGRLQRILRPQ